MSKWFGKSKDKLKSVKLDSPKALRTPDEIRQEYNNAAFKSGNLQYEIVCKQKDLGLLNDTMRSLNFEFVAAESAAKASAAKEEAEKAKENAKSQGVKDA